MSFRGGFREFGVPVLAIGVRESDKTHRGDFVFGHVLCDRRGHERVVLRRLEDPIPFGIDRFDDFRAGAHANHRGLQFGNPIDHGHGIRGNRRTERDIDMIFRDECACVFDCGRRVGCIVQYEVLDTLPIYFPGLERDRIPLGNSQRGSRARRGERDSDLDLSF